jgi:hypothetical protein
MDYKDPDIAQETLPFPTDLVIPEITDERLTSLYSQIKPLVEIDGNKHTLREFTLRELRHTSYYWNYDTNCRDVIGKDKLDAIQDFHCLHEFDLYRGFFRPSIAEVLSQLPENVTEKADFFEIVEALIGDDMDRENDISNAGFHLSRVRVYRLKI